MLAQRTRSFFVVRSKRKRQKGARHPAPAPLITFNSLLRSEGIDPSLVKLARHQDNRYPGRPTPFQLWRASDGRFELYQRVQSRSGIFDGAQFLASFVATPLDETLFVGLFEIKSVGLAPKGLIDPLSGDNVGGYNFYDLEASPRLGDYRGRVAVEWGEGYRAWVQRAGSKDKPVIEIRRSISDPPFPGFLDFRERLSRLSAVPSSWREALSSVGGVYLLTCPNSGKQYVGSANGATGFWGRWEDYVASGHGGNRRMEGLPASDYQVTVLEVAASSASTDELLKMESRWKEKLLTRRFGLNGN